MAVLDWLLDSDPAIRWQVKRDLLGASADEVDAERALVATTGWGRDILDLNERNVGVLGLSFKAGTDDLRESPVVELVERLLGKGHDIRIFDHNVNLSRLVGANRAYIFEHLPHIARLLVDDVDEVVNHGGTIVVGNSDRYFAEVVGRLNMSRRVVDLVRIANDQQSTVGYNGICW